ncbi:hypothetical protein CASFOL_029854 [Castilleja foliolosa]|uniref:DYW domain-containing protein n=1 Tax=Castilleja foliolosa TaxID=1961234 RepID=A0ABD3CBX6_9LAMI
MASTTTTVIFSPPLTISAAVDSPIPSPRVQIQSEPNVPKIKSCKSLQEIKQLHGQLAKQGPISNPTILTKLISKYSEMGSSESLEYATKAFKIFKNNIDDFTSSSIVYVYNSLIRGNSLSGGDFREAILTYVDMLVNGVEPDNYTFPFVLSACAKSSKLFEGLQLHASIMKTGYQNDVFVSNSLVYWYGECGETDSARKMFDEMPERNVVSWTSLICAYAARDSHRDAVSLFFKMEDEGIEPNEVTVTRVISSCAKLGDKDMGERVLDVIKRSRLKFNGVMLNALVDMYMKCGAENKAMQIFNECVDRNLVLYNTVMSNFVKMGKASEAVNVFREMLEFGMKPDRVTMLSVITSSDFRLGVQCHAYVLRNGLENWDNIGNSLIDMYTKSGKQEWACRVFNQMPDKSIVSWNSLIAGVARKGDVESAKKMFDEMPERNIVSWNTMIGSLVQQSLFSDAIELFHCMQSEGTKANEVTMVNVASACGYLGALDLAKWTYNYIEKNEIKCNVRLSTSIVDMFARCGDTQSAMKVFNKMEKKDVSAWTAAIGAMAMEGNGKQAVKLFNDMLSQEIVPDEVVFSAVLTACSHTGLVDQGMQIFNSMKEEYGIEGNIVHYGCIVDLLGRAGFLGRALAFIKNMPIEPNGEIWSAFLGACRIHKNEKMAFLAAEMIPNNEKTGLQILLSNIYASAGKWDDVAKVRMHMKEKGMKKIPGSSSIEINGVVHEFTCGDESYSENELTVSMLEEINCRLRDEGYVPDLTNVLLDIDEREKEFLLGRHSEKLAIAFGLVSTGKGIAVRVVKNLRMCSDCHLFAKMVSRVYDRDIVVRDNNRFHFFQKGLCSCCDYW